MRLDEVGPAWWDDTMPRGHGGDVACLSDITLTHVAAIRPKRRDVPEYQYASYAHISTDSMSGFLAVADVGCGGYVGLLTAGPLSGKVFTASSEPVEPRTAMCALWPKGAHKPTAGGREIVLEPEKAFGFFDWYEEWLDRGIANYTGVARLPFIGIRLARARQRLRKE
jgi:hypothetical protein